MPGLGAERFAVVLRPPRGMASGDVDRWVREALEAGWSVRVVRECPGCGELGALADPACPSCGCPLR